MSSVRVFGTVGPVVVGTQSSKTGEPVVLPKANRQLLAALVAIGPGGQPHDRLAEIVWPAGLPRTWHAALRLNVSRLREHAPGLPILSVGGRYRLACPADAVDAWWLDELIHTDHSPSEPDLLRAIVGRPYDDVASGPTIDDARHVAEFQQRRLIERFATVGANTIRDETSDALVALAVRESADIGVVDRVVAILRTAARDAEADRLLPTASVAGLPLAVGSPRHPALIAAETTPLVGRSELLAALTAPASCLLLGRSGSGRTRLIAAATRELDKRSRRYLYLTPAGSGAPPLAPLLVAVPQFDATRPHWQQLMTLGGGEPVHIFVDDANRLDSATLDVLHLLVQASLNHPSITVTIAADVDDATSAWLAVRHHLEHLGVPTHQIGGFERCDVESLVRSQLPTASECAINGLVDDLLDATDGQPDFLLAQLQATDPMTMQRPDRPIVIDRSSPLLAGLDGEARTVAVGAAVLGTGVSASAFCLDALAELLAPTPRDAVEAAIMRLWNRELVDELDDGRFRFRDLRLRAALLGAVPRRCRADMHQRSIDLVADLHCRAEHSYLALPLGDVFVTAALLSASAEVHAENRRWHSVARQRERIVRAMK